MSNNPDEPEASDICPDAIADLNRVHNAFTDALDAMVAICKKRRVLLSLDSFQVMIEGIAEGLAEDADHALEVLAEHGFTGYSYTPDDSAKMIAKAHEEIFDHFRWRPIDYSNIREEIFASAFGSPRQPTNPATLSSQGVDL